MLALGVVAGAVGCERSAPTPDVAVRDAWARAVAVPDTASGPGWNSAVYLELLNEGRADDRLVGASTRVARSTEIHESRVEDGVMRMRPVGGVAVPAGGHVALEPGGLHIMLIGVTRSLAAGDTIDVTLTFATSPPLRIPVPVQQR
jgi:copper(I)-binding protein